MRKKLLIVTLTIFMALSLIACSGDKKDSDETDAMKTAVEETTVEKSTEETVVDESTEETSVEETVEEPEVVELTADTIDKYYGFEYAATAPDSMSGFSIVCESENEYFTSPTVPAKLSVVTASAFDNNNSEDGLCGGIFTGWNFNGKYFTDGLRVGSCRWLVDDPQTCMSGMNCEMLDPGQSTWIVSDYEHPTALKETFELLENVHHDPKDSGELEYYTVLSPYEIREIISEYDQNIEVTNYSDQWAFGDCEVTAFSYSISKENDSYCNTLTTVADSITVNSKLADAVAANAPTSGTLDTSGNVVLTWLTESGTTVDITFDVTTEQPILVSIVAATK